MSKNSEAVKVVVRCRPLSDKERQDGRQRIVEMDEREGLVVLRNPRAPGEPPKTFTFDQVYGSDSQQATIFAITARPIVDAVMSGYNGTIFAYGQTGTGKSFTMEGPDEPPELRGIIPATFNHVFDTIARQSGGQEFLVRASYLEVYNEEVRDLLAKDGGGQQPQPQHLELKEHPERGVYAKGLLQFVVRSVAEIASVLAVGKHNRAVGSTLMNQDSSRSHSVFTITVEATERLDNAGGGGDAAAAKGAAATAAAAAAAGGGGRIRVGKLNLVDLAGSERAAKTGAAGDRLKEGIKINLSLTALGNVIAALVDGRAGGHVPYRDSKLTRLLADSLGGNTKTVMVANVGPADWNHDETLSTLRYAHRAKSITNKPRVNEDPKDAMLREFQSEIARLRQQLAERQRLDGGGSLGATAAASDGAQGERDDSAAAAAAAPEAGLVERLRAQVKAELEAQRQQQLEGEALEAARAEAEAAARRQLESLMAASNATEEQRRALREELRAQITDVRALEAAAAQGRAEQEELQRRILELEGKVLHGGENLVDKVDALEARAAAAGSELEVAARQRAERRRRLEQLQLERLDLDAQFGSLEEAVAQRAAQLAALQARCRERRAEAADAQAAVAAERERLLADYRELARAVKLKGLLVGELVPAPCQAYVKAAAEWREYDEAWALPRGDLAGNVLLKAAKAAAAAGGQPGQQQQLLVGRYQDLAAFDARRLQHVYLRFEQPAAALQQHHWASGSSSGGGEAPMTSSSHGGRPRSAAVGGGARRASRPQSAAAATAAAAFIASSGGGGGVLGASSGSTGLLLSSPMMAAAGPGSGVSVRPGSAAARRTKELLTSLGGGGSGAGGGGRGGAGASLLDGFGGGGGSSSSSQGGIMVAAAAVPKARGLVEGSTDAMLRRTARPPSRGW